MTLLLRGLFNERILSANDLEVNVAARRLSGFAHQTNFLSLFYLITNLDEHLLQMCITCVYASSKRMLDINEIPVSTIPVTQNIRDIGIGDHETICSCNNWRTAGIGDIDSIVIVQNAPIVPLCRHFKIIIKVWECRTVPGSRRR